MTYPDVERGSTSGHDKRRRQNANGCLSGGVACTGELRWRNEPLRGGAKHSNARDCRRIEPLCGGVTVPGGGTTLGKPRKKRKDSKSFKRRVNENILIFKDILCSLLLTFLFSSVSVCIYMWKAFTIISILSQKYYDEEEEKDETDRNEN